MFHMSSLRPYRGEIKKIQLSYDPIKMVNALCNHTDIHGNAWNASGLFTRDGVTYLIATPLSGLHPYWGSTAPYEGGFASQTWIPYEVEVVTSEKGVEACTTNTNQ